MTRLSLFSKSIPAGLMALLMVLAGVRAQDVEMLAVVKGQEYVQLNASAPWLVDGEEGRPCFFNAFVAVAESGQVTSATLQRPGGEITTLEPEDSELSLEDGFESKLGLDESWVPGSYQFRLQAAHDGLRTVTLNLSPDDYPSVPRVANYAATQVIDTAADFALNWDPFAGGTVNDLILVEIAEYDPYWGEGMPVFESGVPGEPGALDGTATGVVIPAGTFQPGESYRANLIFVRFVDSNTSYGSDVPAFAGYVRQTAFTFRALPVTDFDFPSLVEARPRDGRTDVPRNSVVAFQFSEAMETNVNVGAAIAWTGTSGGGFTYRWSPDRRTLSCVPNATLPASATITWTLNAPGRPLNVRDASGNPFPPGLTGQFITAPDSPAGQDVAFFLVAKGRWFQQTSPSGSVPTGIDFAELSLELTGVNTVLRAGVTPPGRDPVPLPIDSDGEYYEVDCSYAAPADRDRFFPNGTYLLNLLGAHDGPVSIPLTLPADSYPSDPGILNFEAAQGIDPAGDFILSWAPFANGGPDDIMLLRIEDEFGQEILASPEPGEPGSLNGASSPSYVVPAGTLSPGRSYQAELILAKVVDFDDTSYPGVTGLAAYLALLKFEVRAAGQPLGPRLSARSVGLSGLELTVAGERNRSYAIEASEDLRIWHSLGVQTAFENGTVTWQDWDLSRYPNRFYRAREFRYDGAVLVSGRVINANNGSPVAGAVVSTSLDGKTAITDANGYFRLATLANGDYGSATYSITVVAPGFQPSSQTGRWGNFPFVEIQLSP